MRNLLSLINGRLSGLALAILLFAGAAIVVWTQQLNAVLSKAGSLESFHPRVVQYQLEHYRLKQELRALASGKPVSQDVLRQRAFAFASKTRLLAEPMALGKAELVPGYLEVATMAAELERQILSKTERGELNGAEAAHLLAQFDASQDDRLDELSDRIRLAEQEGRARLARSMTHPMEWVRASFAVSWVALLLWLLYAIRAKRRYRAASLDRRMAVTAMEKAISVKRKFLSMVNHEVRSPLQNIVASAELMAANDIRPESVAAIRRIRHAVSALQAQLRDLLTLAEGAEGPRAAQTETFDFRELVEDVCAEFSESAKAKGLTFDVTVPESPLTVVADPIRIAQVLRNLVENSVRYTVTGGIAVRLEPELMASEQPPRPRVRFSVHDSGPGLGEPAMQRLQGPVIPFETSVSGNGIGLYVIRDVLQQLGGDISIARKDKAHGAAGGSTFTVDIPVVMGPTVLPPAVSPAPAELLSVLIVDDRPDVLASLRDLIHRLGHTCLTAESAAEALKAVALTHFDVLLIDLDMPDVDGVTLATSIREGGGVNASTLLILISAAENRAVGLAWPFDGFLQKPVDCKALRRVIGSRTPH